MSGDSRRIIGAANPRALAAAASRPRDRLVEGGGRRREAHRATTRHAADANRRPEARFAHLCRRSAALQRQPFSEPRRPDHDLRRLFETTPRATELLQHDLISDAALKGDGTSLHQLSAQTADTMSEALRKVSTAGCKLRVTFRHSAQSSFRRRRASPTLHRRRLSRPARKLGSLNRDYLILPPAGCRNCCLTSTSACKVSSSSTVQRRPRRCRARLATAGSSQRWRRSRGRIRSSSPSAPAARTSSARRPGDADLYFELTDVLTIPVLFFTITIPFVFQQWIGEELPQSCWWRLRSTRARRWLARTGRQKSRRRPRSGAAAAMPTTRAAATTRTSTAATPPGRCTS